MCYISPTRKSNTSGRLYRINRYVCLCDCVSQMIFHVHMFQYLFHLELFKYLRPDSI